MKCVKFIPLLLAVVLAGCGGGTKSNTVTATGLKTRALVSNSFVSGVTGGLQIIDYNKNQETTTVMGCCSTWKRMLLSSDRSRTYAVLAPPNAPGVGIFDNPNEKLLGTMPTSAPVSGFVASTDNKFVYAAVRNGTSGQALPGTVEFADTTATTLSVVTVPVPLVTNIAITHSGAKLLAFSDQFNTVNPDPNVVNPDPNTVNLVDPTAKTATPITGFDRPITAFFSADDATAYVVNCGAECGGTQASISVVNMSATPKPTITSTVNVPAATVATLDSGTLYVAGNTTANGVLTVLTVNGTSVTVSGSPITIGDGFHQVISIGHGKAFVGARTCSGGCLSMVDLNAKTVVVDTPKGDVTGAAPIPNKNVFYVTEGGELRIYDTTTNAELAGVLIDIVGKAEDVVVVDQ